MVKKWRTFFGKIRKAASKCKKDLKEELTSWRRIVFNVVVHIVIHFIRKSRGSSRPLLRSSFRGGDTILNIPLVVKRYQLLGDCDSSLFQPEEMLTKRTGRRLGWLVLSLCLLVAGLVLSTSGLVIWSLTRRPADRYLVLLDAGSVHTSVYTYRSVARESSVPAIMSCQVLLLRALQRGRG